MPDKQYKKAIVASSFDLFHAGHVLILKEAKELADYVVAALQTNPTIERPYKNSPILSMEERMIQLQGCKYVDEIFVYTRESELGEYIKNNNFDLRVKGSDHKGIVGEYDYLTPIVYHNRNNHAYSSTSLKKRIYDKFNGGMSNA